MEIVVPIEINQMRLYKRHIAKLTGQARGGPLAKEFTNFVKSRPSYFGKWKPLIEGDGLDPQYDLVCFIHWYDNRALLNAGSRHISFERDLPRIIEMIRVMKELNKE